MRLFFPALLLTLALVAGAAGATRADPGVTSNSVLIGGTVPLTGVAAAYASVGRGADAYFKYWNETHSVNGRKIQYEYLDDAYDPAQTVEQTRRLVQQDHVFAIFNSLGTEHNLAIRPFLNQEKVPQLFVATGATTFGRDYKQYPWSIGFLPSYTAEGIIYGKYIRAHVKNPKIAALYQELVRMVPTPVVELNRAVAVGMADGPEAGLRLVDGLERSGALAGYHLLPATRADLLRRLGRRSEAVVAYRVALDLAATDAERRYLARRIAESTETAESS